MSRRTTYDHTPTDIARFDARVRKTSGCWIWTGPTFDERGYGCFTLNRQAVRAHRFAFFVDNGSEPLPADQDVLHTCDNTSCVRPSHLFLGTSLVQVALREARGRTCRGERSPHAKLSERKVLAILADTRGARPVAAEHGVARSLVQRIRQGKHWQHVDQAVAEGRA